MSYATSRDTINFIDDPIWHLFRQVIRKMRPPRGHEADRCLDRTKRYVDEVGLGSVR